MARKKEERAIRAAHRKEKKAQKYLTDDESLASFIIQLNKLGLGLRDIPGDGNCLFRALGDQLDGHSRFHLNHRQDVARFMAEHRGDFEPFVEDDVPFEQHLRCLRSPGTYAGNDAIVAFSRLHQVTVVIHQLNSPLWEIHGTTKPAGRQIHISYHNGDHYSSVRRIGDSSESPNNIHFLNGKVIDINGMTEPILPQQLSASSGSNQSSQRRRNKPKTNKDSPASRSGTLDSEGGADVVSEGEEEELSTVSEKEEGEKDEEPGEREEGLHGRFVGVTEEKRRSLVESLSLVSGCKDRGLIDDLLLDHGCDFDSTLTALQSVMSGNPSPDVCSEVTSEDSDTSSTLSSPTPLHNSLNSAGKGAENSSCAGAKAKAKQSRTHRKRERKMEKKAKAEQRHREKVMSHQQTNSLHSGSQGGRVASSDESDADNIQLNGTVITTIDRLQVLQI